MEVSQDNNLQKANLLQSLQELDNQLKEKTQVLAL